MDRPRLLVLELWGVGDLALATPFLREAARRYRVTLLAKPHAAPILERLGLDVELIPLIAPWTAFEGKYRLHRWPWRRLASVLRALRAGRFDVAVSARFDPRDHGLMWCTGARERIGWERWKSGAFLTRVIRPAPNVHRARVWDEIAGELELPSVVPETRRSDDTHRVLIHTGAAQEVRVWPLERFAELSRALEREGYRVDVLCDVPQLQELEALGLRPTAPETLDLLMDRIEASDVFVGNDSGPGHLAAVLGRPTFTIFGPGLSREFAPFHTEARWIDGAECAYKPCHDSCRFPEPRCIRELDLARTERAVKRFLAPLRSAVPGEDAV